MTPTVEADLQALRRRDGEAVRRLVATHSQILLSAAMGVGLPESDAEEVTQDTFVAFFEGVERFEGRSSLKTYLLGILYNKASALRRRQRRETAQEDIEAVFDARFGSLGVWNCFPRGPEQEALNAELRGWIKACSDALSTDQRAALYLKEVEGETTESVCSILSVTTTNLGVLLFRARNKMRECLEKKARA